MKQTLAYKQQKTMTVKGESFEGFNLNLKLPSTAIAGTFDGYSSDQSYDVAILKNIYVSAVLKGQSKEPIRIFDNISLWDILLDASNGDWSIENNNRVWKSTRLGETQTFETSIPLPMSVINLKGNESLDLDVRYNDFAITNATENAANDLANSSVIISTKNVVKKQNIVKTLSYVSIDDETLKRYDIDGNVSHVAYCTDKAADTDSYDFIEARVQSDLMNTDIDWSDCVTNNYFGGDRDFSSHEFLKLFKVDTPLKDFSVEIRREKYAVNPYLLVAKAVLPVGVYKRYASGQNKHRVENMSRLLSR